MCEVKHDGIWGWGIMVNRVPKLVLNRCMYIHVMYFTLQVGTEGAETG